MTLIQKTVGRLLVAGLAVVLSVGLMAGCGSNAKYAEGSCCAKAAAAGETCAHPCCVEAAKDGGVCKKCNPA